MKRRIFSFICILLTAGFVSAAAQADTFRVLAFEGDVKISPEAKAKEIAPEIDMLLKSGDRIKTGKKSSLDIAYNGDIQNIVKVDSDSDVVITLKGDEKVELVDGDIYILLNNLPKNSEFQVKTPCAVCGARGTGWHNWTDGKVVNAEVFEGSVSARYFKKDGSLSDKKFKINEGYSRKIKMFEKPGRAKKLSHRRWNQLRGKIYPDARKEEKKGKKWSRGERDDRFDERREGVVERKDDKRVDDIRDKLDKESYSSGGGSITE